MNLATVTGCLNAFEEITEQSELERFGTFLRDAQTAALELEKTKRRAQITYTGHSRTTLYRQKKFRADLASNGFPTLDKYMALMKGKKECTIVYEEEEEASGDETDNSRAPGDHVQSCVSDHNSSESEGSLPSSVAHSERATNCSNSPIEILTLQEEEEGSGESDVSL